MMTSSLTVTTESGIIPKRALMSSGQYRILPVSYDDYIELIRLFKLSHKESQYAGAVNFDEEVIIDRLNDIMEDLNNNFIVKCTLMGVMVGFFIGRVSTMEFSTTPVGFERSFWVRPESRGTRASVMLIDSFIEWLRLRNVKLAICTAFHGKANERASKFYVKKKFTEAGQIFLRKV